MNTLEQTTANRRNVRGIVFTGITLLLATFFVLSGGLLIAYGWTLEGAERAREIHYFHVAIVGVLAGCMIGLSLLVAGISFTHNRVVPQFLLAFLIVIAIVGLPFDPLFFVIAATIAGLVILFYPRRRSLLDFRTGSSFNPIAAIIASVVAVPLLFNAYHNVDLEVRKVGGEHHQLDHWVMTAMVEIGLVIAVLLIATGLPGWRWLSLISGLSLLILGITSLIAPDHAGSWGVIGGLLAVLAGVGYLTFPAWHSARATAESTEPALETAPTS